MKSILKPFFNVWYKFFPPESVQYWKTKDAARAKVTHAKDGSLQMVVEGEKYPIPGFPRGHVLTGPLASLKHKVKNMVFNQVFAEIDKMAKDMNADMVPHERMAPAVKELDRVFQLLEDAEVVPDMKGRIRLIRKVLTFFFQEDDAYRMRWQWAMERFDMNKVKLSKGDLYYMRGKYFKVDKKKKIMGIDFDAYDY